MANVKVRLIVDTENIPEELSQKEYSEYCQIMDNRSPIIGIDPEDNITEVYPGQMIEWSGTPRSPYTMDVVSIDSITKVTSKGKFDTFGAPVLIGQTGIITATVLAGIRKGDEEVYTIHFSVIKNKDGSNTSYAIDPKIRGNN